jgi:4'-phosphopantetheinyl transferase EntD
MPASPDPNLQTAIDALSLPSTLIGHRVISPGDEHALKPEEAIAFATSVVAVRRASGAARIVARQLLAQVGLLGYALPKGRSGAPIWPIGVVGSMSHDASVAVAAIAMRRDYIALGIDIEPAEALPSDLLDLIATPKERAAINDDPYQGRLLFAAKEAVYKAVYPLDQMFLEHHDVQVDLAHRRAVVCNGRIVELRFSASKHLLVVAFIRASTTIALAEVD